MVLVKRVLVVCDIIVTIRRQPRSTSTSTHVPHTACFRSMGTLAAVSDQFRHQWVGWRSRQPRLQEIQVIDIGTHTRFIRQTESIVNDEGISPLIWVDGGDRKSVV